MTKDAKIARRSAPSCTLGEFFSSLHLQGEREFSRGPERRTVINPSKKAQLEIFGLVMIVVLVALGLLFLIVMMSKAPDNEEQRVKESIQAANFLNTAFSVTLPECNGRSMRQLLQDCAMAGFQNGQFVGAGVCSDGVNTCEKLRSSLDVFLQRTFGRWGADYVLFMNNSASVEQIVLRKGSCLGEREGSSRPEIVRSDFHVIVTLHLCS